MSDAKKLREKAASNQISAGGISSLNLFKILVDERKKPRKKEERGSSILYINPAKAK